MGILLWIVAILLVLAGIAGLVIPAVPGTPVIFAGLTVAAWAENFLYVGWGTLTTLAVMALLVYPIDLFAGSFGVKRFGASKQAMVGAVLGAFVGIFFGIPGVLLGPFFGAALGELMVQRDLYAAGRAGLGAALGLIIATVAKLALAFSMIGIFLAVRFL
ncbi:MAG: DUF456 family protein [Chlorobiales bacterium]|nr:DUF456 family protein [Chlorobiales bacterium]